MNSTWEKYQVDEICTLQRGFDLPKRLREAGEYPLVSSSGVIDSHASFKANGPGVVTGRSGSIGNVFYIEDSYWPLNTCLYVKDFHGNEPKFIYYFLEHMDLSRFASGAGVPTLNRNNVHAEKVVLTKSRAEQKRIVAILDEAFASIDQAKANTERNLANARELFDSYLNRVFEEKGEGWSSLRIGELVDCGVLEKPLDGNHGEIHPKKADFVDAGVPFIMASDLKNGLVDQKNCNFISAKQANTLRKGFAKHQDVLLSHKGTIGRTAILSCEKEYVVLTPQGKRPVDTPCSESG